MSSDDKIVQTCLLRADYCDVSQRDLVRFYYMKQREKGQTVAKKDGGMNWLRVLAIVIALALTAAACGTDADSGATEEDSADDVAEEVEGGGGEAVEEEQGDGEGAVEEEEDVVEEATTILDGWVLQTSVDWAFDGVNLYNPTACAGNGHEDMPTVVPGDLATADPSLDAQPFYRPGLLLGPAGDFDLAEELSEVAVLRRVEVASATVEVTNGGGEAINLTDINPNLDRFVSVWWIEAAETLELLDPANLTVWARGNNPEISVSPVLVMKPAQGAGHTYGPATVAEEADANESTSSDVPAADKTSNTGVVIIDTSFEVQPDPDPNSGPPYLQGHGSFIAGVIKRTLPDASLTTVEFGPEGKKLAKALPDAVAAAPSDELNEPVYVQNDLLGDIYQLLIVLAALDISDGTSRATKTPVSALNLSLGSYSCGNPDVAPVGLADAIVGLMPDTPIFAAAGNEGDTRKWWPAALGPDLGTAVESVGATDPESSDWATFSNRGEWVEYCECGVGVTVEPWINRSFTGNAFSWSGTSFATPQALANFLSGQTLTPCP